MTREEAIKILDQLKPTNVKDTFGAYVIGEALTMAIEALKRDKGEWIAIGYDGFADGNPVYDVWECSCCKEERYGDDESLPNFCPDCGADMRK